jgi:hypothetical protein
MIFQFPLFISAGFAAFVGVQTEFSRYQILLRKYGFGCDYLSVGVAYVHLNRVRFYFGAGWNQVLTHSMESENKVGGFGHRTI